MDEKIKYITLVLCDNDFTTIITEIMKSIKRVLDYNPDMKWKYVEKLIYESIPFHIMGYHNHIESINTNHIEKYLKQNILVFFNVVAYNYVLDNDHDGGSCYLDVFSGQIGTF